MKGKVAGGFCPVLVKSTVPCIQCMSRPSEDSMPHDSQESWIQHDPLLLYAYSFGGRTLGNEAIASCFQPILPTFPMNMLSLLMLMQLRCFILNTCLSFRGRILISWDFYSVKALQLGRFSFLIWAAEHVFPTTSSHMESPNLWVQLHYFFPHEGRALPSLQ